MRPEEEASVVFGLEQQCRTLCPVRSESTEIVFLIGTQCIRFDNQVCLMKYAEDTHQVSRSSWPHPLGEIWHIGSAPSASIFSTCYASVQSGSLKHGCTLWQIDNSASYRQGSNNLPEPAKVTDIVSLDNDQFKTVNFFDWQPTSDENATSQRGFLLADNNVIVFDINGSSARESARTTLRGKVTPRLTTGQWCTHHGGNVIAAACDSSLKGWDLRTFDSPIWSIDNAHVPCLRSADFNPNVQYCLATGGDDCTIKLWDSRRRSEPLVVLGSVHSHWVWSVRHNPVHDELLLSCGSDGRVILHSIASWSSEAVRLKGEVSADDTPDSGENLLADGVVKTYEDHEESVYCAAWSVADNWAFASLSYDGRLIISHVPNDVKEHILYG